MKVTKGFIYNLFNSKTGNTELVRYDGKQNNNTVRCTSAREDCAGQVLEAPLTSGHLKFMPASKSEISVALQRLKKVEKAPSEIW